MSQVVVVLLLGALLVAYANGANDNFKGVATLYGSGTVGYRAALAWATTTTMAGSLLSVALADKLVRAFSAKGLVPDAMAAEPAFLASVAVGAALTVILATFTGFPISTTHALTGALVGAGVTQVGAAVNFARLGGTFFLPLIVSPLLAVALGTMGYAALRALRRVPVFKDDYCVCVRNQGLVPLTIHGSEAAAAPQPVLPVSVAVAAQCSTHEGRSVVLRRSSLVNTLHFVSSGAVSFARGLNDAPKIVGLLVAIEALRLQVSLFLVAGLMALGGLIQARRVADTVSRRITSMSASEGLVANLVTTGLVLSASGSGLPVSTTHVSCSSLFGMGLVTGKADRSVIRQILASWVLTLPLAAACSAGLVWLLT